MSRLYALQRRLAITSAEASALLFVGGLLLLGLGVRWHQARPVAFPPETYAALDGAVAEGASALRAPETPDEVRAEAPAEVPVELASSSSLAGSERAARSSGGAVGTVDLNAASEAALQRLPGIGPALAGRIVAYRASHGPFRQARDLVRVRGIGPKTYAKLAPFVVVVEADA